MKHLLKIMTLSFLIACTQKADVKINEPDPLQQKSASLHLVADTIIYDVIIRNTNPYDRWIEKSLGRLQHAKLIDSLFSLVYDKQIKAYDYFSNEELSPKQIRAMEKEEGFARDRIGKIQFTEAWYFDKGTQSLRKEVISVTLGHELHNDSGEIRGYKSVFKLYLNP